MHVDVYPDEVLRVTDARAYMGAVGVDNPISGPKNSPVLEQMAEGFGSLTVLPQQRADGKGVWAFAVWDGGSKEVGSRKAWANWVQLKLDAVNP
jgi:hypothetical protein